MDSIKRELDELRNQNYHLAQEMAHYRDQNRPPTATAIHPQPGYVGPTQPPPQGPGGTSMMVDSSRSLPPLNNTIMAGSSMQGVQYSEERR